MDRTIIQVVTLATIAASIIALPGCTKSPPDVPDRSRASAGGVPAAQTEVSGVAATSHLRESWDIYLLQGKRIGYGRTTVRREMQSGREVLSIDAVNHLSMKRAGQTSVQDIRTTSVETPEGRLLQFECTMQMGPSPIKTSGVVHGDRLDVEVVGPGKATAQRSSMPWSADIEGPLGMEQTLLRRPMQPGERRTVKIVMPELAGVEIATIELTAKQLEQTQLADRPCELLRIETVTRLSGGQKIESTVWTDQSGDMLKNVTGGLEQYRVTKAEAMAKADVAELDLLSSMSVKVQPPLLNAHHTKLVRYRVHLDGADPAIVFATGPSQSIKSIDAHTAEVTVYAIRPGTEAGNPAAPADPPSPDDLSPNSFIQSDNATIVADARAAADGETDPWQVAVALERYVNREVKTKDFSQAFASAAEVAKSREGDCTEHAVFLAALARARGIPARVAIGLVYMDRAAAFGYHMWTEVYIDKRWIPIDGTLALGGIGAAHLKIANSSLKSASAYTRLSTGRANFGAA